MPTAKAAAKGAAPKKKTAPKKEAHPLVSLVPEEWYSEDYYHRTLDGVLDIDALRLARKTRHNTLIEGPTGPGKTSLVMAYGAADRIPVVYVPCNGGADPAALFGTWKSDGQGGWKFIDGPVTVVARHGGILYLDEVNMMPPKVAAVLHGALDKRRTIVILGGDADNVQEATISLHHDCQVIASYNPDYEDTRPLNEAFKNRFALKMVFDYDPDLEREFVSIPVLVDIAEKLRAAKVEGELRTPTAPNMLLEFELWSELGLDFAISNFLNAFHADERAPVREVLDAHRDILTVQVNEYWGIEPAEVLDADADDEEDVEPAEDTTFVDFN